MKVLVTGASGFIGSRIVQALGRQRHEVLRLSRAGARPDDPRLIHWDPEKGELDGAALADVDAVIHLAGENLSGKHWNPAFKEQIVHSRVQGTQVLLAALEKAGAKPKAFIAAAAIGIYGDRGSEELSEESPAGAGQGEGTGAAYLAQVCQAWESATRQASALGCRVVQLRIGLVLGKEGGALKRMLLPFQLGLGGPIGNGKQYYSWISADDLVRIFLFALEKQDCMGVYNAVAPNPVTNAQFTASLGRAVSRPAFFPMPAFAARLAFGEMADALLLSGQKVNPARLKAAGFTWETPFIGEAFNRILNHWEAMNAKRSLQLWFALVFAVLLGATIWASLEKNVLQAYVDLGSDRWGLATLFDAYFAFVAFGLWVAYKEGTVLKGVLWMLTLFALGNFAISGYAFWQLAKWDPKSGAAGLLLRAARPPRPLPKWQGRPAASKKRRR